MTTRSRITLGRVRRQFEQWRRRRARGARIPEPLWDAAVELAREHGISKTAHALRLDYYAIKKRMEGAARSTEAGRFVEIPMPVASRGPSCVVEVEDGNGVRMRLELEGLGADEVADLVRCVWNEKR
jgi:hypothetical protein